MLQQLILNELSPHWPKGAEEIEKAIKLKNPDLFGISTFDFRKDIWTLIRDGRAILDAGFKIVINPERIKDNFNQHSWLIDNAKQASQCAYAPYSKFKVGAAIQTNQGIYTGCNVENASYGLTICAERNALTSMIAGGTRVIEAIAIYTPTAIPTMPCGACRQFINEFSPDCLIISACDDKSVIKHYRLNELLPEAFGPHNLSPDQRTPC